MSAQGEVLTPSLPKGGGAIHSIGTGWGAVGLTGAASFQIPLPISPGRGHAPAISLDYHSTLGNGPFGMGWVAAAGAIGRSTLKGVPAYNDEDIFTAPSGAELLPLRTAQGTLQTRIVDHYNDLQLDTQYSVVRYVPRHESSFDRIEHWSSTADSAGFWLVQGADGDIHLYGKTPSARIADPKAAGHVAQWLLEESLTPHGEQIGYHYKADTRGDTQRDFSAQRYLSRICYANITAMTQLSLWSRATLAQKQWHFELLFDYGERFTGLTQPPTYLEQTPWMERSDPLCSYAYGFELGTRRLCQQILMFHYFPEETALGPAPVLTRRLLLEYSTSDTRASLLQAVHNQAFDAAGAISHWPPLELAYSPFTLKADTARHQSFEVLQGPDTGQGYQLIDLYNDGVPGVLYRSDKNWHYREPLRGVGNQVIYGPLQALERIPVAAPNSPQQQSLADLNGDGQLEWIVAQPGMSGFFTLEHDRQWSGFVPFAALPQEYFHPMGQLADLMGHGIQDLALIGSNSVRLYANQGPLGFAAGADIPHQPDDDRLPLPGDGVTELLAFSDILGSGQQHLIRIRHNEIKCWPNLGRGRFGKGFVFATLPFTYAEFEASQVLLADLDGSGASDLIYLQPDQALIFINRCGNGLQGTPTVLPWPDGVRHDRFCQVSVADLQGLGCASLILSVPHPSPRHWRYDFVTEKPYLLVNTNNNMGAAAHLHYRSSAQYWLDEKQQRSDSNKPPICGLPFAMHLVSEQQQLDLISGNQLTQRFEYRDGYYDAAERKFQGYGLLLASDTEHPAATRTDKDHTPALLRKIWFHTGKYLDVPRDDYWAGDPQAQPLGKTLLPIAASPEVQQMQRALSGLVVREEVFAADDPPSSRVPYTVNQNRYMLQQLQPSGALLVLPLESQTCRYEREASDPACQHTINLRHDRYGSIEHALTIDYARRKRPTDPPPFIAAHQQTWWRDTHDPVQQAYYIRETLAQYIHLQGPQRWRLQLPYQQRSNALVLDKGILEPARISYEQLISSAPDNPLGPDARRTLCSLSVQYYCHADSNSALPAGQASFQALSAYQECAELDKLALAAYDNVPDQPGQRPFDLPATLAREHYHPLPPFLGNEKAHDTFWSLKQGFARYAGAPGFYRAIEVRPSESHSVTRLAYDRYNCHIASVSAAEGGSTHAVHDYRLLLPIAVTDPQGSVQQARYDAFGQLQATSFYGQERGKPAGFAPLSQYRRPADDSPGAAIKDPAAALHNAASACFYAPFNWMGHIPPSPLQAQWIAQGYLTPGGHIRASARARVASLDMSNPHNRQLAEQLRQARREPVYGAVLQADNYPGSKEDINIHLNLTFSDGFGRILQTKQKTCPGMAHIADSSGRLSLEQQRCEKRWRVSARVEYNNKGQAIRIYRAYFVDQHRYSDDEALRNNGYSDSLFYDPLGRPTSKVNARGHLSRQTWYTWYSINEDENDTWEPE